ncbi:MAG: hypothetical protein ACI3WS_02630 [Phascolarctobacterium sp.]
MQSGANDNARRIKIIATLFGAFGQSSDANRQVIYVESLKDIQVELLEKACRKLLLEKKFVPSIAEIVEASRSLAGEVDENLRVKSWPEAWAEIEKAMFATPWGKLPTFSTPEIAEAVFSYGWNTLQASAEADMPIVRAQVRRIYEDVCARGVNMANNAYVITRRTSCLLSTRSDQRGASGGLQPLGEAVKQIALQARNA